VLPVVFSLTAWRLSCTVSRAKTEVEVAAKREPTEPTVVRKMGRPANSVGGETRESLLRAAGRRLAAVGYDRMTLDEVAEEVGITRGAVYRHFGSKQELAVAAVLATNPGEEVVERYFRDLEGDIQDLRHRLRAFILACVQQTVDDPEPTVHFFEIGALTAADPQMAEIYQARSRYVRKRVKGLVVEGAKNGEIAPDTDLGDVVDGVLGLVWAFTKGAATAPTRTVRDQIVRACDLLLQAPPWWIDPNDNGTKGMRARRRRPG
jgi:AcrR family transcriptional regulator